jgi:hypothetical protein
MQTSKLRIRDWFWLVLVCCLVLGWGLREQHFRWQRSITESDQDRMTADLQEL